MTLLTRILVFGLMSVFIPDLLNKQVLMYRIWLVFDLYEVSCIDAVWTVVVMVLDEDVGFIKNMFDFKYILFLYLARNMLQITIMFMHFPHLDA